ncbi:hypothetical protein [Streptomyces africanus]|uniref:hypothetical protein n=1 Tax=Streptomyces africanus TaxID=231024 RepID=UPI00118008DA|nr:hypothetical protein [Streptomyces africanus]
MASIVVLDIVVSWLWYRHGHEGDVNREREEKAFALPQKQARATADDTARARGTGGTDDAVFRRHLHHPRPGPGMVSERDDDVSGPSSQIGNRVSR